MIEFQNVSVIFGEKTALETIALRDLNLHIAEGDFITLIGGNGAGKSTLLNLLTGVATPSRGKIIVAQNEWRSLSLPQRAAALAYVHQDPRLGTCESLTLEENLAFALNRGKPRRFQLALNRALRARFHDLLAELQLGLERRLSDKVALLSGGQRQALSLLMAGLQPCKILLLDEHTAALDPKSAQLVLNITQRLIEERRLTAIMITHQLKQALEMGNRTLLLRQGCIIQDFNQKERASLNPAELLDYL